MVIGIDHGYGFVKTKNRTFGASVAKFEHAPALSDRTVKYDGAYFVVGGTPEGLSGNKTLNMDYYILTLAAIAEELKVKGRNSADVFIGAGLPLTRFGAEKDDFKNYLLRNREVEFEYEDKPYSIKIEGVSIYPQGYAAIIPYLGKIKGTCFVVDIGTGTTDIITVGADKIPDMKKAKTIQHGMSNCIAEVNEQINREFSCDMPAGQIIDMIIGRDVDTSPKALKICEQAILDFADSTLNILRQNKVTYELTPTYVLGGGATLLEKYAKKKLEDTCIKFISDIRANAIGFEVLSKQSRERK